MIGKDPHVRYEVVEHSTTCVHCALRHCGRYTRRVGEAAYPLHHARVDDVYRREGVHRLAREVDRAVAFGC